MDERVFLQLPHFFVYVDVVPIESLRQTRLLAERRFGILGSLGVTRFFRGIELDRMEAWSIHVGNVVAGC